MGKRLVIIVFLLSLALATYIYATRDRRSLKENINVASTKEPRVALEDFVVYRYEGDVLKSTLMARLGHFYEPNVLELDGDVRGERLTSEGDREVVSSESANAYFNATSLAKMMDQSHPTELDHAELTGFVEANLRDHLLTTDYAEYLNTEQIVKSSRPVRVEGPSRVFQGEEGFNYNLSSQVMEMTGPVKGDMTIEKQK